MKDMYQDLESLLFQGFLILPSAVNGCPLILKTMNSREYEHVEAYTAFSDSTRLQAGYVLAYSTYLFNRVNILANRAEYIPLLAEAFGDMPEPAVKKLMLRINALNGRAAQTLRQIEPYSYGAVSRYNWMAYRGQLLNHPLITGIEGTSGLGINYHQKLWAFYNTQEDIQQEYDRQRELAKFQVSAHAPKGVQQLEQEDRERRQREERRRKALYRSGGKASVLDEGDVTQEIRLTQESVEDLLGQMRQHMAGQKDYHDIAITRYEETQRRRYEEHQRRIQRERERRAQEREAQIGSNVRPQKAFVIYDEDVIKKKVREERELRQKKLRAGDYQRSMEFERRGEHLAKWVPGPDRPKEVTPNPLLAEYYQSVTEDTDT